MRKTHLGLGPFCHAVPSPIVRERTVPAATFALAAASFIVVQYLKINAARVCPIDEDRGLIRR